MRAVLLAGVACGIRTLFAAATVTEGVVDLPTYPFSDPDPVPCTAAKRYPYFFFDGSAATSVTQTWRCVMLENDRVRVMVMPQVGGKVWGAIDKETGREFIYFNHAVKFRNIAMRGPWCSGGIEFNFGIMGHSPTTATPVDWCVRTNSDGSASCFDGMGLPHDLAGGSESSAGRRLLPHAHHLVQRREPAWAVLPVDDGGIFGAR